MICIGCGMRYAPYPERDFAFPKNKSPLGIEIKPKKEDAEERRRKVFESNDKAVCYGCRCDKEEEDFYNTRGEESDRRYQDSEPDGLY